LASLGNIISDDCRRDPFGDHGGPFDLAAGLRTGAAILGLSRLTSDGSRHPCDESQFPRLNPCENLLAGLLRPIAGPRSEKISRALLVEFQTLPEVLASDYSRLGAVTQSDAVTRFIVLVRDAMLHSLRLRVADNPILSSNQRLIDYLRASIAYGICEQFRVLFLNARHMLMRDEVMGLGSVREATVFPREVIRRALELGATSIVLVHNHPSGSLEPSATDLAVTRDVVDCGRMFDLVVDDHIIVTKSGFVSFRALGIL
jgi:DNA repair protein RadC